jgi:hypothetical protein
MMRSPMSKLLATNLVLPATPPVMPATEMNSRRGGIRRAGWRGWRRSGGLAAVDGLAVRVRRRFPHAAPRLLGHPRADRGRWRSRPGQGGLASPSASLATRRASSSAPAATAAGAGDRQVDAAGRHGGADHAAEPDDGQQETLMASIGIEGLAVAVSRRRPDADHVRLRDRVAAAIDDDGDAGRTPQRQGAAGRRNKKTRDRKRKRSHSSGPFLGISGTGRETARTAERNSKRERTRR